MQERNILEKKTQRHKNRRHKESIRNSHTMINCIALQRMKPGKSMKGISLLNGLHRTCHQMGQMPKFNKLTKTKTTVKYFAMKKLWESSGRNKHRFFSCAFIYRWCSFQIFWVDSILQQMKDYQMFIRTKHMSRQQTKNYTGIKINSNGIRK